MGSELGAILAMVLFVAALFAVFIPAMIADGKGHSFGGFFLYGFALWPVALIHAMCLRPTEVSLQKAADARGDTKSCPYCAETIKAAAIKCRYCGADLQVIALEHK